MIVQLVFGGLALGSMYALVALGYNITYTTSQTVNFSQGQSVMVGAVVAYALHVGAGWPWVPSVVVTLIALAALGVLVERVAVRPFLRASSIAWLLATIALGIIAENVVMLVFGKDARAFPSSRSSTSPRPWAPRSASRPSRWPSSAGSRARGGSSSPGSSTGSWSPSSRATSARGSGRSSASPSSSSCCWPVPGGSSASPRPGASSRAADRRRARPRRRRGGPARHQQHVLSLRRDPDRHQHRGHDGAQRARRRLGAGVARAGRLLRARRLRRRDRRGARRALLLARAPAGGGCRHRRRRRPGPGLP